MPRAHFEPRPIVDSHGEKQNIAVVHVYLPGTTTHLPDPLFSTRTGVGTRSNPFTTSDGMVDFYLDVPQTVRLLITPSGGSPTFIENIDVGSVRPWERHAKDYGAMGDGVTIDSGALNEAHADMTPGSSLIYDDGVYLCDETVITPDADSCVLNAPPSPQGRLGPVVLRAAAGADLRAIMAPRRWIEDTAAGTDAYGLVVNGLSFDGGGFDADTTHSGSVETTSNTDHCLVIRGNHWSVLNTFVLSANKHGIFVPRFGVDGLTDLGQSHENQITGGGGMYHGWDSLHVDSYQKDAWVARWRPQYAGRNCIYTSSQCGAWSFRNCHPSWAVQDIFHLESGWQVRVIDNYIGGVGVYKDGAKGGITSRGVFVQNGAAIVTGNSIIGFPATLQVDPIVGIHLKNGPVICRDNTFLYQAGETATALVQEGISSPSIVEAPLTVVGGDE